MMFDAAHDLELERASIQKRTNVHGQTTFPALAMPKDASGKPTEHSWSPYADNGGTVAAIAGDGYVILGGDTRLNGNYSFLSRDDDSKIFRLTDKCFLASTGMQADRLQLQQVLKHRIRWFKHNNGGRTPSTPALAQMLSSILYGRRFFAYYTFNVLAGIDEEGNGVCYSYDAVGCTEPLKYGTTGSGSNFVEPLLDCLFSRGNQRDPKTGQPLGARMTSEPDALKIIRNAFTSAAERDCNTGDGVNFYILKSEGGQVTLREEHLELRHD